MTAVSASSARRKVGSSQKRKVSFFLQSSTSSAAHQKMLPQVGLLLHHNESFSRFITKLDSIETHESNFGNLCMKKAVRSKKRGFHFS